MHDKCFDKIHVDGRHELCRVKVADDGGEPMKSLAARKKDEKQTPHPDSGGSLVAQRWTLNVIIRRALSSFARMSECVRSGSHAMSDAPYLITKVRVAAQHEYFGRPSGMRMRCGLTPEIRGALMVGLGSMTIPRR